MAGRRTNLALLVLLAGAVGSGGLAFALGSGWNQWVVVAHGAVALGIVLLAPWKSVIARRGLRRRRPGWWASITFTVLITVALAGGLGHATGLLRTIGPLTAMQVHVGAALASVPFGIWHVLGRRVRPRRVDLSRRTLLRSGALAAGSLVTYGGMAGVISAARLPGRARVFTGSYEVGSFQPDRMPITQWLDDVVPAIDPSIWMLRLRIGDAARSLTLEELSAMTEPVRATIDCTGGWFAEQDWEGVRLDRLLGATTGRSVIARSATGYWRRYPLRDARYLWLATRLSGMPLSAGHGAPARIVAPARRGFWWVKWLTSIEVSDTPWWWQPPFPVT